MAKKSYNKKKSKNKMKILGFDLTDKSYLVSFIALVVVTLGILALIIVAIVNAASGCGAKELPENSAAVSVSDVSGADVSASDIVTYDNSVFTIDYDRSDLTLFDHFEEAGYIMIAKNDSAPVGLTVSYKDGMAGTDPAEHLDRFVDTMSTYGTVSDIQSGTADEGTAERSFNMELDGSVVSVKTKMFVSGDKAMIIQLSTGDGLNGAEVEALENAYASARFC